MQGVDVRGQVASDLDTLLREANAAVLGSRRALPPPAALSLFERVLGIHTPVAQAIHGIAERLAVEPTPVDVAGTIAYLSDRVFNDANYLGDAIYQISPELLCTVTAADPSGEPSGGSAPPVDAACVAQLAKLDLRIHTMVAPATPDSGPTDGGLVFAIQLDAHHDEPLTITLRHRQIGPMSTTTSLTAELDLDVLQRALGQLAVAMGPAIPAMELSGQLTLTLQGDPTGASAMVRIDRPLSIKIAGADGDVDGADAFSLSSAASRIFDLVLVANQPLGTLHLNLGETTVRLPARADGKRLGLDLAGFTADASLTRYLPLEVVAIGLGGRAATVSVDGVPAQTIDINPEDGHDFNVLVQPDEANHTLHTLQFNPKLDLRMTTDHAVLGDAVPVYDTTRVFLDGIVRTTAASDRLEVTAGSYRIETAPASHGFAASAGQCVTGVDAADPSGTSSVQWTVGACP